MANPFTQLYDLTSGASLKNVNPNQLINIFSGMGTANSTPAMILPGSNIPTSVVPTTQTLPNGGGTFNAAGKSTIAPAPIFAGAKAPVKPTGVTPVAGVNYDKYRDPKTGEIMTPQQYAVYLGNKVPKGNGEITNYAGDAMMNPNESAADLTKRATNLNNSRNDIATGTTDPYGVGNKSGIAYSPAELRAIEKAYAGVYDPALNDVFARLKTKQEEDKAAADRVAAREDRVFATNEAIRQWKATTGTKGGSSGSTVDLFTDTQLNTAARNAGISTKAVRDMDPDLVNFFISPPKALGFNKKSVPYPEALQSWITAVEDGKADAQEVKDLITDSSATPEVKTYYINMVPDTPGTTSNESWLQKIWGTVWDITKGLVQ